MGARGDQRVGEAVHAALEDGPLDVLALLAALRASVRPLITEHEGRLHAWLHRAVRTGVLVTVPGGPDGRARYARADRPPPPPVEPGGGAPPEAPREARWIAAVVRDPAARARVEADVAAHQAELAAGGRARHFGPAKVVRTLLKRVDRGRPSVCFTMDGGDRLRRFLLHDAPWLVGAVIAFFLLRAYVVEVFVIPSRSMVPTLEVGDRVVVFKPGGRSMPDRWTIVTFVREPLTYVKRVAGRGGEEIALLDGDLYVDGHIAARPDAVREAMRLPYAAWDLAATPGAFSAEAGPDGRTVHRLVASPLWSAEAPPAPSVSRDVPLRDVYLTLEAERAADGEVLLAAAWEPLGAGEDAPATAALALRWRGEAVELLGREDGDAPWRPLAAPAPAPAGGRATMRLSYVDGVVRASLGDARFRVEGDQGIRPAGWSAVAPRYEVAGAGSRGLRLVLDKDLHYGLQHELAVAEPGRREGPEANAFRVPPGHVFLLGDNTTDSRDSRSRSMGPVPVSDLVGPVHLRIWPPSRIGVVR